jgi:hypothetical protein
MILKQRIGWAIALLTIAVLSREAMLIAAAGSAFWLWRRGEKRAALLVIGIPFAAVAAWAIYLRLRIGFDTGVSEIQEIGLPLVGFISAFRVWVDDPLNMAAGIAIMLLFFMFARRALAAGHLVGWTFLGFIPLALLFTRQVWHSYIDITRAVAPILTAFVLLVFLAGRQAQRTSVRP